MEWFCVIPQHTATLVPADRRPTVWVIAAVAVGHLLVSFVLFIAVIGMGMKAFDGPRPPSIVLRAANAALMLWSMPLITPILNFGIHLPRALEWLTFVDNSLSWGFAAWYFLYWIRVRRAAA